MENEHFLIFFDTETTGLNPEIEMIFEIGSLVYNLNTGKLIDKFEEKCYPGKELSDYIMDLTRTTNEELKDKRPTKDVLMDWSNFVLKYASKNKVFLVAHNAPFDCDFIYNISRKYEFLIPNVEVVDTLQLSKKIMYSDKYKLPYLVSLIESESGEKIQRGEHNALTDCYSCAKLLSYLLKKQKSKDTETTSLDILTNESNSFKEIIQKQKLKKQKRGANNDIHSGNREFARK